MQLMLAEREPRFGRLPAHWTAQFGGDPAILGREVPVDSTPVTIVGVMPQSVDRPPGVGQWTAPD